MSLIPGAFLDSVAAVGTPNDQGSVSYVATAFLFGHPASEQTQEGGSYWTFIVTNRHVVELSPELWIRFRGPSSDQVGPSPSAQSVLFPVRVGPAPPFQWILHPEPEIDLAVLPLDAIQAPAELLPSRFLTLDKHATTKEELRSSECNEGNDIFTLGFPLKMAGESQNDVIVHRGIIARIQDWYDGRTEDFLIDSSVYPGNSGGPVVLKPVLWSAYHRPRFTSARLIGLVASYIPYQDVAVSQQTGRARLLSEENSGLARVVPIDALIGLTATVAAVLDTAEGRIVSWEAIKDAVQAADL